MYAEADVVVDDSLLVREAAIITEKLQAQAGKHLPALASLRLALATGIDPEEAGRAGRIRRHPMTTARPIRGTTTSTASTGTCTSARSGPPLAPGEPGHAPVDESVG